MYLHKINPFIYLFFFAIAGTLMTDATNVNVIENNETINNETIVENSETINNEPINDNIEVNINKKVKTIRVKLYSSRKETYLFGNNQPPSFDPKNAIYFYARAACVSIEVPEKNRTKTTLIELKKQILTAIGLGPCCDEAFKKNIEAIKVYRYDGSWLTTNIGSWLRRSSYRKKVANILLGKENLSIDENETLLTLILPEKYFQIGQAPDKAKMLSQGVDLLDGEEEVITKIKRNTIVQDLLKFAENESSKELLLNKDWVMRQRVSNDDQNRSNDNESGSKNNNNERENPLDSQQQTPTTSPFHQVETTTLDSQNSVNAPQERPSWLDNWKTSLLNNWKISALVIGFLAVCLSFFFYLQTVWQKKKKMKKEDDYEDDWASLVG